MHIWMDDKFILEVNLLQYLFHNFYFHKLFVSFFRVPFWLLYLYTSFGFFISIIIDLQGYFILKIKNEKIMCVTEFLLEYYSIATYNTFIVIFLFHRILFVTVFKRYCIFFNTVNRSCYSANNSNRNNDRRKIAVFDKLNLKKFSERLNKKIQFFR